MLSSTQGNGYFLNKKACHGFFLTFLYITNIFSNLSFAFTFRHVKMIIPTSQYVKEAVLFPRRTYKSRTKNFQGRAFTLLQQSRIENDVLSDEENLQLMFHRAIELYIAHPIISQDNSDFVEDITKLIEDISFHMNNPEIRQESNQNQYSDIVNRFDEAITAAAMGKEVEDDLLLKLATDLLHASSEEDIPYQKMGTSPTGNSLHEIKTRFEQLEEKYQELNRFIDVSVETDNEKKKINGDASKTTYETRNENKIETLKFDTSNGLSEKPEKETASLETNQINGQTKSKSISDAEFKLDNEAVNIGANIAMSETVSEIETKAGNSDNGVIDAEIEIESKHDIETEMTKMKESLIERNEEPIALDESTNKGISEVTPEIEHNIEKIDTLPTDIELEQKGDPIVSEEEKNTAVKIEGIARDKVQINTNLRIGDTSNDEPKVEKGKTAETTNIPHANKEIKAEKGKIKDESDEKDIEVPELEDIPGMDVTNALTAMITVGAVTAGLVAKTPLIVAGAAFAPAVTSMVSALKDEMSKNSKMFFATEIKPEDESKKDDPDKKEEERKK